MKYILTNLITPNKNIFTQEQIVRSLAVVNCPDADVANSELLSTYGYAQVPDIQSSQPTPTSIVVVDKSNNEWYLRWMEEQDYNDLKNNLFNSNVVRKQRNKLLSQTDWTQCKDVSNEMSTKWVAYRQALRDITSQEGFPDSVTWPTPPQ